MANSQHYADAPTVKLEDYIPASCSARCIALKLNCLVE